MQSKKVFRLAVGVLFPLALLSAFLWAKLIRLPLPCVLYLTTGILCPSCGGTRAIISLLRGDILSALRNNLFITVTIIPAVILLARLWLGVVLDKPGLYKLSLRAVRVIACLAVIYILFGILRNIPEEPFIYLTPIKY